MSLPPNLRMPICMLALASLFAMPATAQLPDEFPPNAVPGKCYAKCVIPATYENYTEQVVSREASTTLAILPERWEKVTEQIMVAEASTKLNIVPATYETIEETVMVKPAGKRLETVPAVYDTVTETIEVSPATTRWEKRDTDQACFSTDPEECRVWCLVDVPAVTKTISRRVLTSPATTREVTIPAEYETVTRRVVKTPASTSETTIPAKYDTMTKYVLASPASVQTTQVPAQYETVTRTRRTSEVGATDWREVLCEAEITVPRVRQIQQALRTRGYDPGPIDNVIGPRTRAALLEFQRANNLPEGSLDVDTLRALDIDFN